ncbi:MAG: hypothetical protein IJ333_07235 [Clostridia bacterium]|nr:hypothetical protein [Clostridia bacterium]
MIDSIQLIEFQDVVECQSLLHQSKESFLPINYTFKKGNVYGLISDFGCGSWALSTCLGGRCSSEYSGKVLLNNNVIHASQLSKYAGFISEKTFQIMNSSRNPLTPKECIEKALKQSGQPYSVEEIKKTFCLSGGRFERSINNLSGEIWLVSMAVNFAFGKEIFCYPWLNMLDIERFKIAYDCKIIEFLKKSGKIIIVPSSQKRILLKYCDHTVSFHKGKVICR